jgi:hypothetical protein
MTIAYSKTVTLAEGTKKARSVTVRELTVSEVRAWLKGLAEREEAPVDDKDPARDAVDWLLLDGCSLSDLARMTDLPVADMAGLHPSDLRVLLEACQAMTNRQDCRFARRRRPKGAAHGCAV